MDRARRRAFTLIELLVVIAVIAILAAILFPVFAQAREKARAAGCLSNMKQLGTAERLYLDDYDGAFPLAWFGNKAAYGFDVALFPYVKSYGVYDCPSNHTVPRFDVGYPLHGVTQPIPGSYSMNGDLAARAGGPEGRSGITEASVSAPAETILLTEIWDDGRAQGWFPEHEIFNASKRDVCTRIPVHLHQGGSDYMFCDGHAKWERVEQTWAQWHANGSELNGLATLCDQRRGSP